MKTTTETHPLPDTDEQIAALQNKTRFFKKLSVNRDVSSQAGDGLAQLLKGQVDSQTRLGLRAISLTEAGLSASLLARTMPAIGALTIQANAATCAVDQALTNGAHAEHFTHMKNRSNNIKLTKSLQQAGEIASEECSVLVNLADEAAVADIQRSHERMLKSKQTVDALYDFTLQGIEAIKGRLQ